MKRRGELLQAEYDPRAWPRHEVRVDEPHVAVRDRVDRIETGARADLFQRRRGFLRHQVNGRRVLDQIVEEAMSARETQPLRLPRA